MLEQKGLEIKFDKIADEDCWKPLKTNNSAFNGKYIEYERRGDKDKNIIT